MLPKKWSGSKAAQRKRRAAAPALSARYARTGARRPERQARDGAAAEAQPTATMYRHAQTGTATGVVTPRPVPPTRRARRAP